MDYRVVLRVAIVSLLLLIPLGIYLVPHVTAVFFGFIFFLTPLWLPLLLISIFIPLWLTYIRSQYVASVPYTLLELKPGEQTPKTAKAMELIFYSLYHRTELSRAMELFSGQVRLPWSFEISAHDGVVRFFVRMPTVQRQAVELRIRSEYRDIDIDQPRDYARELDFHPSQMKLVMREYTLQKPDPYPIKTFEMYEKEKNSSQPFSKLLDALVGVGAHEHLYISLITRPHQRSRKHFWKNESDELHTDASQEIANIIGESGDPRQLPKAEQDIIAAIEGALKKPSFDCGLRAVYIATRDAFSVERINDIETIFAPFGDTQLNEFFSYNPRERITWPLSDVFAALPWLEESYYFDLYRRRAFFTPPYYGRDFVLNTAELATLFHLPYITRSSALARMHGTRLEPPENLPI